MSIAVFLFQQLFFELFYLEFALNVAFLQINDFSGQKHADRYRQNNSGNAQLADDLDFFGQIQYCRVLSDLFRLFR